MTLMRSIGRVYFLPNLMCHLGQFSVHSGNWPCKSSGRPWSYTLLLQWSEASMKRDLTPELTVTFWKVLGDLSICTGRASAVLKPAWELWFALCWRELCGLCCPDCWCSRDQWQTSRNPASTNPLHGDEIMRKLYLLNICLPCIY